MMMEQSWKIIRFAVCAIALPAAATICGGLAAAGPSATEAYPSKLVRIVVPLSAGSPIDLIARIIAPALSSRLKQTVIVENRPGGGTMTGTRAVATASADGYTLLFASAAYTLGPAVTRNLGYDPIKDLVPIATVGSGSWVLVVTPSLLVHSVKDLIAYAKANPAKLNWGFGRNAGPHLLGELFVHAAGMEVNRVYYKSGADAVPDLLGGRIEMNFGSPETLLPLILEGKLRALVVTSQSRSADLPDVPTMIETGFPRLTHGFWTGLLAPARTPIGVVTRFNAEVNASLASPETKANLLKLGVEPKIGSPQDFAALVADEIELWKAAAKTAGIEPE